jgi:hypothetical protein
MYVYIYIYLYIAAREQTESTCVVFVFAHGVAYPTNYVFAHWVLGFAKFGQYRVCNMCDMFVSVLYVSCSCIPTVMRFIDICKHVRFSWTHLDMHGHRTYIFMHVCSFTRMCYWLLLRGVSLSVRVFIATHGSKPRTSHILAECVHIIVYGFGSWELCACSCAFIRETPHRPHPYAMWCVSIHI